MADEGKKRERSRKASIVTRRVRELENGVKMGLPIVEIKEKIRIVKHTIDELGELHDSYNESIEGNDELLNESNT